MSRVQISTDDESVHYEFVVLNEKEIDRYDLAHSFEIDAKMVKRWKRIKKEYEEMQNELRNTQILHYKKYCVPL